MNTLSDPCASGRGDGRVGKARPPGTRRPSLAISPAISGPRSQMRRSTRPVRSGPRRRSTDFSRKFQGIKRQERASGQKVFRLKISKHRSGRSFSNPCPQPWQGSIMGLPVFSNSLVSRHKIDYFQISGHCHGFVESIPGGCPRGGAPEARPVRFRSWPIARSCA